MLVGPVAHNDVVAPGEETPGGDSNVRRPMMMGRPMNVTSLKRFMSPLMRKGMEPAALWRCVRLWPR